MSQETLFLVKKSKHDLLTRFRRLRGPNRNVLLNQNLLIENDLLAVPMDKSNGFAIISKHSYTCKLRCISTGKQFRRQHMERNNAMNSTLKQ